MALTLEVGTAYDYPTIEDAAAALGLTLTSGRDWSSLDGTIPGMVVDNALTGTPTTPGVYTVTAREVSIYGDYYTKTADVTVNGPEPEPEPAGSTLVPDVLEFLGLPDNPDMRKLATQHVRIVTTFVRNYTRGNGFDAEGVPNADLHDVIITATARYLPNPQQATRQSLGNQSIGYATIEGFTLTEKAVLNRYRKMTSRGNIVTTTSTSTGTTTSYATVQYVDSKVAGIPTTNLDGYATVAYVDDVAASMAVDLNPYATRSYVDVAIDQIPDVDLSDYVTTGELSAAIEALPEPEPVDLSGYATETYVDDAVAAIPEPDLSGYATETYVATAVGNTNQDTGTRNVTGMLNTANVTLSGSTRLFLRRIGPLVFFWGTNIVTTKTGPQNVTAALPQGFKPPLANYNGPILTDASASHLGTATLRENNANNSVTYGVNFNVGVTSSSSCFSLIMPAADPWPTTLPGVAA